MIQTNLSLLNPTQWLLSFSKIPNSNFFCQSVKIPDVSFGTRETASPIHDILFPGDKLTFGELTASIVVDSELKSYLEMYSWMRNMTALGTTKETVSDCMLNLGGNTAFKFKDAFPVSLSGFYMSNIIPDAPAITFDASFKFVTFDA